MKTTSGGHDRFGENNADADITHIIDRTKKTTISYEIWIGADHVNGMEIYMRGGAVDNNT